MNQVDCLVNPHVFKRWVFFLGTAIVSNGKPTKYDLGLSATTTYNVTDPVTEPQSDVLDDLAYETKMNVIAILEFILDIRLDFRISRLISIFKQKYDRLGKQINVISFCS